MRYLLIILSLFSFSFTQDYQDVVYLKNGSIIKGIIIETKPNEYIKIKSGENIFVYNYDQIDIIKKEEYEIDNKSTKGFIVGIGLGIHSGTNKFETYDNLNRSGLLITDFKLGYAPNDYIEIYYTNKRSTYKPYDIRLYNQLTGFGLSFFSNSKEHELNNKLKMNKKWFPSYFISICYGRSYYGWDDPNYTFDISGSGFSVGVGYEFKPHARIEINWISLFDIEYYMEYEGYFDLEINEISLTLNYMYF